MTRIERISEILQSTQAWMTVKQLSELTGDTERQVHSVLGPLIARKQVVRGGMVDGRLYAWNQSCIEMPKPVKHPPPAEAPRPNPMETTVQFACRRREETVICNWAGF